MPTPKLAHTISVLVAMHPIIDAESLSSGEGWDAVALNHGISTSDALTALAELWNNLKTLEATLSTNGDTSERSYGKVHMLQEILQTGNFIVDDEHEDEGHEAEAAADRQSYSVHGDSDEES